MDVEFDPEKDAANRRKHGISLGRAAEFDLSRALTKVDDRRDYGEVRYRFIGRIDRRLHMLVFTMRGDAMRAISLRAANKQEVTRYAEASKVREA